MSDFLHPDRIVIGAFDEADGDRVAALHEAIEAPVVRCDVASAEMIKLAANAALMTRISFINEIANVCEATGADVVRVAEGVGLDRRIGPSFLRAGIGYGGIVLSQGLARPQAARRQLRLPLPAPDRRDRGQRAAEAPADREAAGSTSATCAERRSRSSASPSSRIPMTCARRRASCSPVGSLAEGATVRAWDPVATPDGLDGIDAGARRSPRLSPAPTPRCSSPSGRSSPTQDWAALGGTMRRRVFVDGRNMLDPAVMRAAGFTYEGIGRGAA